MNEADICWDEAFPLASRSGTFNEISTTVCICTAPIGDEAGSGRKFTEPGSLLHFHDVSGLSVGARTTAESSSASNNYRARDTNSDSDRFGEGSGVSSSVNASQFSATLLCRFIKQPQPTMVLQTNKIFGSARDCH